MKTKKEIETKQRAILEIKRIRKGLSNREQKVIDLLNKRYRDDEGRLVHGSFYINSNGEWEKIILKSK